MEGALKLKEISYIHAEAYPAGELKHGPLALVDSEMPVVAIAPNDALLEKLKSNLQEVRARGGELYVFSVKGTGVRASNITYRTGAPDKRGVIEIEIGATVSGDYANIVRFINGLEHSETFYVLDSLVLGAGSSGGLGLNLHLRTFFRSS